MKQVIIKSTGETGTIHETHVINNRHIYTIDIGGELQTFVDGEIEYIDEYTDVTITAKEFSVICNTCGNEIMVGEIKEIKEKNGILIIGCDYGGSIGCDFCSY
jgi:hypothetical protein